MTITKGVSQGKEFFELHNFSHQNVQKSEFHTYCHKTLACDYFLENKAFLMIFRYFNARLNFLSVHFCLNWRKFILKVFNYVSYVVKNLQYQYSLI